LSHQAANTFLPVKTHATNGVISSAERKVVPLDEFVADEIGHGACIDKDICRYPNALWPFEGRCQP
jgi:hypothetical protein